MSENQAAEAKHLEKELQTYKQKFSELESHIGKYVVIRGDEIEGIFDTYSDALNHGYEAFGLDPFLVKHIEGGEQVQLITRLLTPA